ncbi:MAG: cell division protein SepF [Firmicutes bacterium]|nr:cell division protein SepF [Bacillota bacterium]
MSGFLDKMGGFFFKDEESFEPEEEREETVANTNAWREPEVKKPVKRTNLISVPTRNAKADPGLMEMVLIKATSYDDMQEIAKHIKERKVAVVNFEDMDKDIAQRMVDFLSGATFALDGVPRKVSGGTFIFSSSSVGMVGQIMEKGEETENGAGDDMPHTPDQWFKDQS